MFIKSIKISGFRCFKKNSEPIVFSEHEGMNILVGMNGSGKTAVLEAIDLLFGRDNSASSRVSENDFHPDISDVKGEIVIEAEVDPFFFSVDGVKLDKRRDVIIACNKIRLSIKRRQRVRSGNVLDDPFLFRKEVIPIQGKIEKTILDQMSQIKEQTQTRVRELIEDSDATKNIKEIVDWCRTIAGCDAQIKTGFEQEAEMSRENFVDGYKIIMDKSNTVSLPGALFQYQAHRVLNFPKALYLSKDRTNDLKEKFSLLFDIFSDIDWREKKRRTPEKIQKIHEIIDLLHIELSSQELKKLLRVLNEDICKFSDRDKGAEEFPSKEKLVASFFDTGEPYKKVFLALGLEPDFVSIDRLGSGYYILFSFLLFKYILTQEEEKNNRIILLVDEPEMHLHPQFQKKLLDALKEISKKTEVFISTHSPYFIDPDIIEGIYRLENQKKLLGVKVFRIINATVQAKSLFHLENRAAFFARKVVLVEGFDDKDRFSQFLEDGNEYDFFVMKGLANIETASKIFNDLNIHSYSIVDLDFLSEHGCSPEELTYEEVQNIEEYRELDLLLPKIESPVLAKFLKDKVLKEKIYQAKKCLCSKMLLKIESDVSYKKSVETKIEEFKKQRVFILRYGMIEHYLDKNGSPVSDEIKCELQELLNSIKVQ